MWIVVVVDQYYPSVMHYSDEEQAKESFNKNKSKGNVTHIAKVERYHVNDWDSNNWDVIFDRVER